METAGTIEPEGAVADCASNQDSMSNATPVLVDFKLSADAVQKHKLALFCHARGNTTLRYALASDTL
jgi:hypothetical protein